MDGESETGRDGRHVGTESHHLMPRMIETLSPPRLMGTLVSPQHHRTYAIALWAPQFKPRGGPTGLDCNWLAVVGDWAPPRGQRH